MNTILVGTSYCKYKRHPACSWLTQCRCIEGRDEGGRGGLTLRTRDQIYVRIPICCFASCSWWLLCFPPSPAPPLRSWIIYYLLSLAASPYSLIPGCILQLSFFPYFLAHFVTQKSFRSDRDHPLHPSPPSPSRPLDRPSRVSRPPPLLIVAIVYVPPSSSPSRSSP
jgi:hypothetical protein